MLILLFLFLGGVIWLYSEIVLLLIASTYAFTAVTLHLIRFFRHRLVSRTAPS